MTYIAFEGIDGSGKTTQFTMQVNRLKKIHGSQEVEEYRYSAKDNPVGRVIKRLYGRKHSKLVSFLTNRRFIQEGLYALNARENLARIRNISTGRILLSDRSVITAHASHVGIVPEWFLNFVEPPQYPDLAIFIDISPEEGYARIADRDSLLYEENIEDLRIFRYNYERIFKDRPRKLRDTQVSTIDGHRSIEEVANDVTTVIDQWIEENHQKGGRQNGRKR